MIFGENSRVDLLVEFRHATILGIYTKFPWNYLQIEKGLNEAIISTNSAIPFSSSSLTLGDIITSYLLINFLIFFSLDWKRGLTELNQESPKTNWEIDK